MKKVINLLFALLLLGSTVISAQSSVEPDPRLLVNYSEKELKTMKDSDPKKLEYLNYCLENAFYIADFPKEKASSKNVGSIKIKDIENFNFFELKIEIKDDNYSFLKIEGTTKMLVVRSKKHILENLNK